MVVPPGVIPPCRSACVAAFANHSCEPNCSYLETVICYENPKVIVYIVADEVIDAGDKITTNYSVIDEIHLQECHCGSSLCRGYIGTEEAVADFLAQQESSGVSSLSCGKHRQGDLVSIRTSYPSISVILLSMVSQRYIMMPSTTLSIFFNPPLDSYGDAKFGDDPLFDEEDDYAINQKDESSTSSSQLRSEDSTGEWRSQNDDLSDALLEEDDEEETSLPRDANIR
ncbi:hypothetical protein ADUPG1_009071 [Aduncisulcus paluster]|uniref:Post-SET domain-containing protein n=1 Tax=Aduncisulcus paluster TaxID=2918883 RepID=A0ABQ5KU99_9EUKA|nr:hypothetical protein ADUPG1_009071 [Aduncisulcus paluster]